MSPLSRIGAAAARWPRWLLVAGVLAVGFYLVNALHYGHLPLRIEENEWPPMAAQILEEGKPVVEADETHRVRFTPEEQVDPRPIIGAWHPPLYLYTLAATMTVLGDDASFLLRGVGVAGLLLAALLLVLIAREVAPERWRLIGGVAAILLLIHPYAVQGSLFLDIDTSIYAPAILLALWLAIRFGRQKRVRPLQLVLLGAALALVMWTKLTTAVGLLGVLTVWWLLFRRPVRRAAAEAAGFLAVGLGLFFSTYAAWCAATGIPFSYTFDVTFRAKSGRLLTDWWLTENAALWHLRWFGPLLLVLGLVYAADLLRHLWTHRRLRELDLLFLLGAAVLFNYVLLSPTDGTYQGKYAFPALPALLLPLTWLLLRRPSGPHPPALLAAAAAVGLLLALLLPDLLTGLAYNGNYGDAAFALRIIAAAAAGAWIAWRLGGRRGLAGGVVLVLAALSLVQAVRSYSEDTSPLYPVDDTEDFRAAARDANGALEPGDIAFTPKDLGFYLESRVIEGEDAFARGDELTAEVIRERPEVKVMARTTFGPPIGPATQAVMDECFQDVRTFGTAVVAHRTGCP